MKPRLIAIFTCLLICNVKADLEKTEITLFGDVLIIALPYDAILNDYSIPIISSNGKVGFVSSVMAGAVISFSLESGKMLSSIRSGELAGIISMVESNNRRVIALPTINDLANGRSATVEIIEATDEQRLEKIVTVSLPPDAQITPSTRPLLTADGLFGVIASSSSKPALFSFNVKTGEIISKLMLSGKPSQVAIHEDGFRRMIAIVSEEANSLTLTVLDDQGGISTAGSFSPHGDRFEGTNNPVFGQDGRVIYIGASMGDKLFVIDAGKGTLRSSVTVPSPQRITVAQDMSGADIVAVTRIRKPIGHKSDGVTILKNNKDRLTVKTEFELPDVIHLSPVNNVVFGSDATTAYVGSKNGIIFAFDVKTGELRSHKVIGNEIRSLASNTIMRALVAVRSSLTSDEIVMLYLDQANASGLERQASAKSPPEIRQVSGEVTHIRLAIQGTNLEKGLMVEFVKAGNVILRHTPEKLTDRQLMLSIPVKKLEVLGKFELRVVTADNVVSNVITVEPMSPISKVHLYPSRLEPVSVNSHPTIIETSLEPPLTPATQMRSIRHDLRDGEIRIYIDTDGLARFKDFTLEKPSRIVVDIQGVQNAFGNRIIPMAATLIERIRVGQPKPGVVRIVLDSKKAIPYRVIQEGASIIIIVSGE